ncbi:MAG: FecR domain-containing protein [Sporocytophaga sp.]|uniref:FecR family protein n=1 Tax=Sporocytophaga sp. TaxID=2231183 RepID=UPI001B1E49CB|nr:FecR family protein [Sporocytophaga sp.]MBO9702577.1 FecR domain-containing protein [Sporocytophaga sp.]
MKNSKETDLFKEAIREKFQDEYLLTDNDNDVWNKVYQEISDSKSLSVNKKFKWYYAAAAALIIISGLAVSIFVLKQNNTSTPEMAAKPIESPESSQSSLNDNKIEEKTSPSLSSLNTNKSNINNVGTASVKPIFAHAVKYSSEEKSVIQNLEDGSVVTLNNATEFNKEKVFLNNRNVQIDGEAFFEVSSDKEHPFTVYFGQYKLVVVGTKFNVRNRKDENYKEITVLEGIVKVFDNNTPDGILVTKGQQLTIPVEGSSILKQVDAENFLSWKTGKLDFRKTRLEDIALILSRTKEAQITVDNNIKKCKFTGDLSGLSIDEAIQVITLTNALKAEKTEGKIHLTGNSCE